MTTAEPSLAAPPLSTKADVGNAYRGFAIAMAVLIAAFGKTLYDLAKLALDEEIHSHILLIPAIVGYLIWIKRSDLPHPARARSTVAIWPAVMAAAALLLSFVVPFAATESGAVDRLSLRILSFCLLATGLVLFFLGGAFARDVFFPLAFLFFIVPLPEILIVGFENVLMRLSADAYALMMSASQATYFRDGQIFVLPNLTIKVAQECSGIRSSLVLFLTSLLAGHMFLKTAWKKVALALLVFPLGVFRNAFRIYVLSMLSAHWDPNVIHSPLHHKGGPVFFALSLVPFFLVLFWFRKTENRASVVPPA